MKVYAISDLHLSINNPKPMDIFGSAWEDYLDKIIASWDQTVSNDDLVLISGDISWAMQLECAKPDLDFIGDLKGHKILIRGNHDYWWKSISAVRSMLKPNTYALQNDCIKIGDVIVCGSRGWTSPEGKTQSEQDQKIYNREVLRMQMSLCEGAKKRENGEKLLAMIHYPPFNSRFQPTPFTDMFSEFRCDAVIYGHLHGKNSRANLIVNIDGIDYFLTSCDMTDNNLVQIL